MLLHAQTGELEWWRLRHITRIGSWDTVKGELYSAEFELKCSLVIIYLLDELSPFCSIWHRNDAVEGGQSGKFDH